VLTSRERVGPTAHYTGYVWARNGLSHPELETREGRLLFDSLQPAMLASRALGGPTLEAYLLARHRAIDALLERAIDAGRVADETGRWASRNRLQTTTLLDAIEENRFDAVFGGARRDEEKARAKERMFSFRDEFGQWDPKNQRPELWNLYNTKLHRGEHIRVFPLSNWTELDVWHYIWREELEIPSIYFAHQRQVFERDGILLADSSYVTRGEDESLFEATVRYRTVGDMTCTGAVESTAATIPDVITEIAATRITERGQTRADDRTSEAAMEDRKREGYF